MRINDWFAGFDVPKIFDEIKDCCEVEAVSETYAKQKCTHAHKAPIYNPKRQEFFKDLNKDAFINELSKKYIFPSKAKSFFSRLKHTIKKVTVLSFI